MRLPIALTGLLAFGLAGCKQPPPPVYQSQLTVESDPGVPVVGAAVMRGTKEIAKTGPDGKALLKMRGTEGEMVELTVKCPDGFAQPKPISIALHKLAEKAKPPEYSQSCPPSVRNVVVAVRAEEGANVPVKYLGQLMATTDASGAAHFALQAKPGDTLEVVLDTSANARMRPASPPHQFRVEDQDRVYLLKQTFQIEKEKPKYVPKATLPQRLPVRK